MKKYKVLSQNLSNSLVFYRALFNRMPDVLAFDRIVFLLPEFELEIKESLETVEQQESFLLPISSESELQAIARRMHRFQSIGRMQNDCESITEAIGLEDPDGYRWVIGNPKTTVNFNKCYIENQSLNTYNYGTI